MKRKKPKFKKGDLLLDVEYPDLFYVCTVVSVDNFNYHMLRTVYDYYQKKSSDLIIIENRITVEKVYVKVKDLEQCEILYK